MPGLPKGQAALSGELPKVYGRRMKPSLAPIAAVLLLSIAAPLSAEDVPVPYWASTRVDQINMRVGPGEDYRINWVFRRKQLPMKVIRLKEGWRLVVDPEGAKGWVMARFLSRERTAIVFGKGLADMRETTAPGSPMRWRVEPGVNGKLGECTGGWCEFEVGPHKGWVEQGRLWGAGEP